MSMGKSVKMDKERASKLIFNIIFLCIIFTPMLLMGVSKLTDKGLDKKLKGEYSEVTPPVFKVSDFKSAQYQTSVGEWLHNSMPPRGIIITAYNQIRYSMFKEGNRPIGKSGYIFEDSYIWEHCCIENYDYSLDKNAAMMMEYVRKLAVISDELEKLDKHLIVLMGTSKADYFEEEIPEKYLLMGNKSGVTAGECFDKYARQHDLAYLNCDEYLSSIDFDYPIYYKSGIHWARTVEQQIEAKLLDMINNEFGVSAGYLRLGEAISQNEPFDRDADVFELQNLFQNPNETYYIYDVKLENPQKAVNIVFQGDSYINYFTADFVNYGYNGNIYRIFYGDYLMKNGEIVQILSGDFSLLDMEALINENDIFIIGYTKPSLCNYGYGYVDALYNYFMKLE